MAFVRIGRIDVDFDTREISKMPVVRLQKGKGYLFYLRLQRRFVVMDHQYMLVIPTLSTPRGRVEFPLECKFFPKGLDLVVPVAVPDSDSFDNTDMEMWLLPRRLYRSADDLIQVGVAMFWDDNEELDVSGVAL